MYWMASSLSQPLAVCPLSLRRARCAGARFARGRDGMSSRDEPLVEMLGSFFTAAINLILHGRGVYPKSAFERCRLFDVPIHVSRHPEVRDYIELVVRGARELVARGEARSLVVLVLGAPADGQSQPPVLERFVFELGLSLGASGTDRAELRGQLRGFLVKLNFCDSLLSPLPPDGLEFGVEVHTHQAAASAEPTSEELRELWVECDLQSEVGRPTSPQVVPLKSVSSPELSMQLFVMEAASKGG